MQVGKHQIIPSVLTARASEDLEREVEEELERAKASKDDTPDVGELLKSLSTDKKLDELGDGVIGENVDSDEDPSDTEDEDEDETDTDPEKPETDSVVADDDEGGEAHEN